MSEEGRVWVTEGGHVEGTVKESGVSGIRTGVFLSGGNEESRGRMGEGLERGKDAYICRPFTI